ncbi:MAG TPA: HD family phosphohydrolase [Nostocaceae cyanobacterium]|nr:HD family phosphohydrolase [Nostocaceae cyanobacterium]
MKTQQFLQSLNQHFQQWRRQCKILCRKGKRLGLVSSLNTSGRQKAHRPIIKHLFLFLSSIEEQHTNRQGKQTAKSAMDTVKTNGGIDTIIVNVHAKRSSMILVTAVVSLTGVIGHQLYNQPQLKVGSIAPETFKAPYTDSIEDKITTAARREEASNNLLPVWMVDVQVNEQINENLSLVLNHGDYIRATAGAFPFFDVSVLSLPTQQYLRSCSEVEWNKLQQTLENNKRQNLKSLLLKLKLNNEKKSPIINQNNNQQSTNAPKSSPQNFSQQAIAEIEAYRATATEQNLAALINQILEARQKYTQAKQKLSQLEMGLSEQVYTQTIVLELSDEDWKKTRVGIRHSVERILTQGIPYGLPRRNLRDAVSLHSQSFVPSQAEPLATELLMAVLKPNLKPDQEKTQQKAQRAAAEVEPVIIKKQLGEVIVYKGQKITQINLQVLEHYQLVQRRVDWLGLILVGGLVTLAIGIFVWVERRSKIKLRQRDRLLVLLLTLSVPVVLATGIFYTSWSAVGLLLGSFYGSTFGFTVIGLLSILLPISTEISKGGLVAGAIGGLIGSYFAQKLRSREELALLGVAIALTQGSIYLIFKVLIGAAFGTSWYLILQEAVLFGLSGLAWSVVALGLSPYLEKFFDLITPIRLAELSNPNRTLLQKLSTETPGTFQHTLFVATLAEAAAKELGCNVELVRAGTLYHDIGKMHDPLGFIENQMGGPNKHDTEIKDPWKSAEIIKKHVTEGLAMAKKHSLPTAIQAFIPEHQGTMAIAYFYHQAQQMAKEDPSIIVNEADFRYDGPIPQSRETGIVMLADSCEAALRSLTDTTPEQALNMLNNILRARWQDGQMADSGLTREEMTKIAQIFVEVWQQFHHKRIAYPKLKSSK